MTRRSRWNSTIAAVSVTALAACTGGSAPTEPTAALREALTSSLTVQRGSHGAVTDATINAKDMKKNLGGDEQLIVSKRNESLVRFDLASIPSNAIINSATLTLYMHGHDDGDDDHDDDDDDRRDEDCRGFSSVPVYVQRATAAWVESKVSYASFNQQFDGDVAGILLPSGKNTYKAIDLKSTVQAWVSGSKENDGVVLRTTSRKRWRFASSENGRVTLRPSLTISYSTPDEHCQPNPCLNGGACVNGWTGYTCQCPAGFTGTRCDININECSGNPCKNGGRCTNGQNSYECACVPGFSGTNCEVNIDDCASRPCQNGGVCTDGVASYTCACATGFTGANCEVNINDCAGNPCQNGGSCTDGIASYTCACAPGFSGTNCEVNIDDCAGAPCQNGGVCVDGVNKYSCNCAAGFSGANCEVNINDCASAPCQNGGTCHDGIASYTCACAAGYSGTNCEVNIDDCASHPCQNGGTCVDEVNAYVCSCAPGFSGTNCEINNDDCSPNHCQNGGTCIDGVNTYTCTCVAGYTGANCETNIDDCASAPCQNGGTCVDGVNSYTCACASGFSGNNCETVIDPCAGTTTPDPSHQWTFNDGTATDGMGGANGTLLGGATISGGQLIVDNTNSVSTLGFNGQRMQAAIPDTTGAKTLVSWVSLANLSQHGGSALTLESTTTNAFAQRFDAIDYAERTANQWMSGSDNFSRSPANNGGALETSSDTVMVAIVYGPDNSITIYHNGVPYSAGYVQGSLQTYAGGASDALIGLRHSGCSNNCWLSGAIDEARIYPVALNACQIKTLKPAP